MTLPKQIKVLYGADDEATGTHTYRIVKRLYRAIAEEYGAKVRQTIVNDDGDTFIAVTDCGWWRLDLMAWSIGHPGVSKHVMRMREFDPGTQETYRQLLDADRIIDASAGTTPPGACGTVGKPDPAQCVR